MMGEGFRLATTRQLLDAGVAPARAAWRSIFWPVALPAATISTLAGVAQMRLLAEFMPLAQAEPSATLWLDLMSVSAGAVVLSVVLIAALAIVYTALTAAALDVLASRRVDMARAWRLALQPSMLWTVFLCLVFATISLLLCVVPAFFVLPLLSLVLPVALIEGHRGMGAISRGIALMRPHTGVKGGRRPWVRSLVVLLVTVAIGQALALLVQGPFMILQQVWMARDVSSGGSGFSDAVLWLQVPMTLLGTLAQVVAWIYAAFTLGLHYHDVRLRASGDDLEVAIQALEQDVGSAAVGDPA